MYFHLTGLRRYFHRRSSTGVLESSGGSVKSTEPERGSHPTGGLFNNASNFSINNPQMNDFSHSQIQQLVLQTVTHGDATIEHLLPYTCRDASLNSSARHPPPRCHEGTRKKVGEKITIWFHNPIQRRKTMWLYGPAGTGKSAVAQTFGEYCEAEGSLGASFFFSRPNHRDKYETVIPTIAYQLATSIPSFRAALTRVIAADPTVLDKSPRVQLKKLLVEPFSELRFKNDPSTQKPLLIVLDGLDECHGLEGQLELVEMVNEANQSTHLPLLWLICSRPEPHLTYIFSRVIECDRHQLLIDADTRQDVRKYLWDGFITIQKRFWGTVDENWPPPELFRKVIDITDGLFVLGTAVLGYIGNSAYANPNKRLTDFLSFMEHVDVIATDNPLETLDLLYSRILMDIPEPMMSMTRCILHHCVYNINPRDKPMSTQVVANFLCLGQQEFYGALRSLHSVLEIPSPKVAAKVPLRMYHASFKDYLSSPSRAGRFFISEEEARAEFSRLRFFWYNIILEDEVSDDHSWDKELAPPSIFPHLKWTSGSTPEHIAQRINYVTNRCSDAWEHLCNTLKGNPAETLSFRDSFKFKYMQVYNAWDHKFLQFLSWLSQQGEPGTLLHTEPANDVDKILLKSVIERFSKYGLQIEPMVFPLKHKNSWPVQRRRYCFLGQGMKTCLFWTDRRLDCLGRARLSYKAAPGRSFMVSDCVVHASRDYTFD